jgi:membrane fusion protein, multidrug efflux system
MSGPGNLRGGLDTAVDPADRGSLGWLPGGMTTIWILLAVLLIAFIGWRILSAGSGKTDRGFGANAVQSVGVAKATSGDMDITLNALGTVTPLATVTVKPQVGGTVVKIDFTEGQMVKAGDPLVEIDPRPFQAALDQAKGQLARDAANLANAQLDLKRFEALAAQNAISNQQLATQRALVQADMGVVASDNANVKSAAINLGYAHITAPVGGRVGLRQVDLGNVVSAGQSTGVVVVTQEQPISVLFTLPEDNIADVMVRLQAGDKLSVAAYDRGQTQLLATGTLETVDNQIDTTTGTVKARALFDNTDGKLFPNQFVNVRLLVDTLRGQTLVPVPAVQRGAEGNFVFVVKPDKSVAQRTVTLGPGNATQLTVTQGLKPGDTVVVDGADRLRDGSFVNPTNAAGPIANPSGTAANTAGGGASDADRAARRAALMKICGADIAKYCSGKTGREMFMCMRENRDDFSAACQAALKKMRPRGGGGRSGGGGP